MMDNHFADIILPLAVKGTLTYSLPESISGNVFEGSRVLVQLGHKKLYSGIVSRIHNDPPSGIRIRPIEKVLEPYPIVNPLQLKFWAWMAEYYMCGYGEVMKAALPSDLCLEGVKDFPVIEKYKPRVETFIIPGEAFSDSFLNEMDEDLARAPRQRELLVNYLRASGYDQGRKAQPVRKSLFTREAWYSATSFDALIRKNILATVTMETGRLNYTPSLVEPLKSLSPEQEIALESLRQCFAARDVALLFGVTSSGKTEIYIRLIEEQLRMGKQVLYLLPEISLTTQIIHRLRKHFGHLTGVYHSRFNNQEKVEIWNRVAGKETGNGNEYRLIIGARSALFLPFSNLGLIVVDEEHDGSYKQQDPSPRYNARDSAIVLAKLHGAKAILGSASPSVESYYNAITGKYGLVELKQRYGAIKLPEIILANTKEAYRRKLMISHFTPELLYAMEDALSNNEQVILFQNRRGFSPYIECTDCGWIPSCVQCAVSLTYHKADKKMICHYCGFSTSIPGKCESCGSSGLSSRGFGTEKIEDEVRIIFPSARIARMDQDTTRGKNSFENLIKELEKNKIDILIGTQMISKGLDIENLTVVGILNADNMLNFPDFRAHERSFQMMEQVSGRAGRRQKTGRVIIQTSDPDNKIIKLVLHHDFKGLFRLQSEERKAFNYPPFCRMIRISLRHKDVRFLNEFSGILGNDLKSVFGKRVLGPEYPLVSRVQSWYIKNILIKLERDKSVSGSRELITKAIDRTFNNRGASALRLSIDVDPY